MLLTRCWFSPLTLAALLFVLQIIPEGCSKSIDLRSASSADASLETSGNTVLSDDSADEEDCGDFNEDDINSVSDGTNTGVSVNVTLETEGRGDGESTAEDTSGSDGAANESNETNGETGQSGSQETSSGGQESIDSSGSTDIEAEDTSGSDEAANESNEETGNTDQSGSDETSSGGQVSIDLSGSTNNEAEDTSGGDEAANGSNENNGETGQSGSQETSSGSQESIDSSGSTNNGAEDTSGGDEAANESDENNGETGESGSDETSSGGQESIGSSDSSSDEAEDTSGNNEAGNESNESNGNTDESGSDETSSGGQVSTDNSDSSSDEAEDTSGSDEAENESNENGGSSGGISGSGEGSLGGSWSWNSNSGGAGSGSVSIGDLLSGGSQLWNILSGNNSTNGEGMEGIIGSIIGGIFGGEAAQNSGGSAAVSTQENIAAVIENLIKNSRDLTTADLQKIVEFIINNYGNGSIHIRGGVNGEFGGDVEVPVVKYLGDLITVLQKNDLLTFLQGISQYLVNWEVTINDTKYGILNFVTSPQKFLYKMIQHGILNFHSLIEWLVRFILGDNTVVKTIFGFGNKTLNCVVNSAVDIPGVIGDNLVECVTGRVNEVIQLVADAVLEIRSSLKLLRHIVVSITGCPGFFCLGASTSTTIFTAMNLVRRIVSTIAHVVEFVGTVYVQVPGCFVGSVTVTPGQELLKMAARMGKCMIN